MGRRLKETPLRYCLYCNKKLERSRLPNGDLEYLIHFNRKKYCDRICMAKAFHEKPKTDNPSWYVSHERARTIKKATTCEKCGSTQNVDVHHKDRNWQNNSEENLQALCRSCHIKEHKLKRICMICEKPYYSLGYCEKHYIRFRKYGNPLISYNKVVLE